MDAAHRKRPLKRRDLQSQWYGEPWGALSASDRGPGPQPGTAGHRARAVRAYAFAAHERPARKDRQSGRRPARAVPPGARRQVARGDISAGEARPADGRNPPHRRGKRAQQHLTDRLAGASRPSARGARDPGAAALGLGRRRHHRGVQRPRPLPPGAGRVSPGLRCGAHRRTRWSTTKRTRADGPGSDERRQGADARRMGEIFAGRYELVDPIGRGGVGMVWRAWDHRRRRYVAAKVLQQSDAHTLLRFVREQALRIDHPHVLAPASWAADDDKVLFTMDLVAGGSLAHLIGDYGPLPPAYVCTLLDQLLSGLAAVHEEGVVHRDIKPANILLEATGTGGPMSGWGTSASRISKGEPRLTEANYVMGTPGYFAPEQMMGEEADFPSDLFAVGLVDALSAPRAQAGRGAIVKRCEHGVPYAPEGVPEPLWQVIAGQLQPDPQDRFRTATGARKALVGAAEMHARGAAEHEVVEVFDHLGPLPRGSARTVRPGRAAVMRRPTLPRATERCRAPRRPPPSRLNPPGPPPDSLPNPPPGRPPNPRPGRPRPSSPPSPRCRTPAASPSRRRSRGRRTRGQRTPGRHSRERRPRRYRLPRRLPGRRLRTHRRPSSRRHHTLSPRSSRRPRRPGRRSRSRPSRPYTSHRAHNSPDSRAHRPSPRTFIRPPPLPRPCRPPRPCRRRVTTPSPVHTPLSAPGFPPPPRGGGGRPGRRRS